MKRLFRIVFFCMSITNIISAQHEQRAEITQALAKSIPMFITQARALGFSDQEIAKTLDQVVKKEMTEQGLADFVKRAEQFEEEEEEEEGSPLVTYLVIACCGIIGAWLLHELYQDIKLKNTREVWLSTDPEGAIPEKRLIKTRELILRALRTDEEPRDIVKDLAKKYPGVCVKTRLNNGGARRNITYEC